MEAVDEEVEAVVVGEVVAHEEVVVVTVTVIMTMKIQEEAEVVEVVVDAKNSELKMNLKVIVMMISLLNKLPNLNNQSESKRLETCWLMMRTTRRCDEAWHLASATVMIAVNGMI